MIPVVKLDSEVSGSSPYCACALTYGSAFFYSLMWEETAHKGTVLLCSITFRNVDSESIEFCIPDSDEGTVTLVVRLKKHWAKGLKVEAEKSKVATRAAQVRSRLAETHPGLPLTKTWWTVTKKQNTAAKTGSGTHTDKTNHKKNHWKPKWWWRRSLAEEFGTRKVVQRPGFYWDLDEVKEHQVSLVPLCCSVGLTPPTHTPHAHTRNRNRDLWSSEPAMDSWLEAGAL